MRILLSREELIQIVKQFVLANYSETLEIEDVDDIDFENESLIFMTNEELTIKKKE